MPSHARSEIIDSNRVGIYHCTARCVRRAFLCGADKVTGRSFEHRRAWMKDRIEYLSMIFAIDICNFSIMSNHYHINLRNRPDEAKNYSDEEILRRWWQLYPRKLYEEHPDCPPPEVIKEWLSIPGFIEERRKRLSSISLFMKALNEWISRKSNKEEGATGRFWEGRFWSQELLDSEAVMAAGIYIDLNPIKAKMAESLETSDYTSIQDRIRKSSDTTSFLAAISKSLTEFEEEAPFLLMDEADYIVTVRWHADLLLQKHSAANQKTVTKPFAKQSRVSQLMNILPSCPTALGSVEALQERAKQVGKKWLKGIGLARKMSKS